MMQKNDEAELRKLQSDYWIAAGEAARALHSAPHPLRGLPLINFLEADAKATEFINRLVSMKADRKP